MATCYLLTESGAHLVQEQGSAPHALLIENCDHHPGVGMVSARARVRRIAEKEWEQERQAQRPLTRQKWQELLAAWDAQEKLEQKAQEEEDRRLAEAADVAAWALLEAEERQRLEGEQVRRLTRELERAAKAKTAEQELIAAQMVQKYAIALSAWLKQVEDDDAAILLLL